MPLRRKRKDPPGSGAVEIYSIGQGLVVEGTPTAVSTFVDQMVSATREVGGQSRHLLVDGFQLAANVAAYRQTHREYLEFSERAWQLLKEHGAIPTEDGYFRSFVKLGIHFAGNLDWKPAQLGPEQALGMQAMAGQLALRAAIKDVVAALERIEGKVDRLAELAKAERLGAAQADRATLFPLVERARETGKLSGTDWATVASLGPWIARDVESLRAYILEKLKTVDDSSFVRARAAEAEELTDQLLRESLALLVVAEQNYALWQELRVAHAACHEVTALASVTQDVHEQLATLSRSDQRVVDMLQDVVGRLTAPTGYEGFAPLQKRRLNRHADQLNEMLAWFAAQRHLDYAANEAPELPRLGESLSRAGGTIAVVTRSMTRAIVSCPDHLRSRRTVLDPGEGSRQFDP